MYQGFYAVLSCDLKKSTPCEMVIEERKRMDNYYTITFIETGSVRNNIAFFITNGPGRNITGISVFD